MVAAGAAAVIEVVVVVAVVIVGGARRWCRNNTRGLVGRIDAYIYLI